MAKNKKKNTTTKKISIQLSWSETAGWLGVLLLICGWFFVLGIAVGRGLIPAVDSRNDFKKEILAGREKALNQRAQTEKNGPTLNFHEALLQKDSRTAEKPPDSSTTPEPSDGSPELPAKTAEKYEPVTSSSNSEQPHEGGNKKAVEKLFTIQIASLRDRETAHKLVKTIKTEGYPAYAVKAILSAGEAWYRVRTGDFASREEADPIMDRLQQAGFEPILVKR